jgi:hypothetical protein
MSTTPRLWKSQTQVNTTDAPPPMAGGLAFQLDGQVAPLANGGYVVVWTDMSRAYAHDGRAIVGQRYDALGNKVGGEAAIAPFAGRDQYSPATAVLPNGNVAIAYVDLVVGGLSNQDIRVHIFSPDLLTLRRVDLIDTSGTSANDAFDPSITAFADGSYVVSYTIGSGSDTDIVAHIVSPNGTVGPQFDVENSTDNRNFSEVATLSDGNFVVVYQDEFGGSSTDTDIKYRIFSPTGTLVSVDFVPGANGAGLETDPDVAALRDGGFAAVWTSSNEIRASVLSNAAATIAAGIHVNTTTAGVQDEASVVGLADGGFLVTWEDDTANLVRAQRFDAAGHTVGAEFTVKNGVSPVDSPEAALLADGRIAYAVGDVSTGDPDVMTSIFSTAAPTDFNPNGISDILWQGSNGTPALWLMDGTNAVSVVAVGSFNPGPSWQVKDSGDFNGDGDSDILWQGTEGTPAIWLMDGTNVVSASAAGSFNPGPSWQVKDSGDFNGDGKSDVLWQSADGTPAVWLMDGTTATFVGAIGPFNPGPSWEIKGTGDFNGDGKSDILWQSADGTPAIWLMDGTTATFVGAIGPFNPGPSWEIKGTGDFNGDSKSDILWQSADGTPAIWLMDDTDVTFVGAIGPFNPGPSWEIKGTGDYNGDNRSDILWQSTDGTPAIWFMDGMNFISGSAAGSFNPGHDWHIIA